jgi:twitching motility protein PilT
VRKGQRAWKNYKPAEETISGITPEGCPQTSQTTNSFDALSYRLRLKERIFLSFLNFPPKVFFTLKYLSMNYASQILNYLGSSSTVSEVFLAPNASPMERKEGKLVRFMPVVLTSEDIRDTLVALKSHSSGSLGPLGKEGSFSFGIHKSGRFRVAYMTQRGSYVISIIKTPYEIPIIEELCQDPSHVIKEINRIVGDLPGSCVVITGRDHIKASMFAYSLLQHVSINFSKVISILEKPLNYLLKHGNSLVIQREIGTDVESLQKGLEDAMLIKPDILYIGHKESFKEREIGEIVRILESGALVFISIPYISQQKLVNDLKDLVPFTEKIIMLEEEKGAIKVSFRETQLPEWETR